MNPNTTSKQTVHDGVQHSKPIPISTQHLRDRSMSFSSDSSNSPTSSPPLLTPNNLPNTRIAASSSSPILYYLSQSSPTKAPATFPFRGFVPPPVAEGVSRESSSRSISLTLLQTNRLRLKNVLRPLTTVVVPAPPGNSIAKSPCRSFITKGVSMSSGASP